jgi:hypothetical protein
MRMKGRSHCATSAWAATGRVQIQLGEIRYTATHAQAVDLARQSVAAVDEPATEEAN